jgi:hypothetical protein
METKLIARGTVLTVEQIAQLGLKDTGTKFADMPMFKRADSRYLLEKVDDNLFRVYLEYKS